MNVVVIAEWSGESLEKGEYGGEHSDWNGICIFDALGRRKLKGFLLLSMCLPLFFFSSLFPFFLGWLYISFHFDYYY